jgi:hypothetical protein
LAWLQVLFFVKESMVAWFDNAGGGVEIDYVLISCHVSQEDPGEVMSIQLTMPRTGLFEQTKLFQVSDVQLVKNANLQKESSLLQNEPTGCGEKWREVVQQTKTWQVGWICIGVCGL